MTNKANMVQKNRTKYRLFMGGIFAALILLLGRTFLNAAYSVYVLASIVGNYGLEVLNDATRNEMIASFSSKYASFSGNSILSAVIILSAWVALWNASVYLVAQFVLPVSERSHRRKAAKWFSLFIRGGHGAAVFVKEGKIIERKNEKNEKNESKDAKPGVALVDLSSAVVLSQEEDTQSWNLPQDSEMDWDDLLKRAGINPAKNPPLGLDGLWKHIGLRPAENPPLDLDDLTKRIAIRPREKKKHAPFVEVKGPGLAFIEKGQKIFSVIDLRPQSRSATVEAYTRDGIRLSTRVSVSFSLSGTPETITVGYVGDTLRWLEMAYLNEGRKAVVKNAFDLDEPIREEILSYIQKGAAAASSMKEERANPALNTPYPFYPHRVFRAAYSNARCADSGELMPWHSIPLEIAIDIFRRKLAAIPYDELYPALDFQQANADEQSPKRSVEALKKLKDDFGRAVKMRGIINIQFLGRKGNLPFQEGETYETREISGHPVVTLSDSSFNSLRGVGVVVKSAGFGDLQPVSPEIKKRMVDNWKAKWEKEEHFIHAEYELEAVRMRNRSRAQIQQEMTYLLANIFQGSHTDEALALRVFQALEAAATNPVANTDISPKEIVAMLDSLHKWLLVERNDILKPLPSSTDAKHEA